MSLALFPGPKNRDHFRRETGQGSSGYGLHCFRWLGRCHHHRPENDCQCIHRTHTMRFMRRKMPWNVALERRIIYHQMVH